MNQYFFELFKELEDYLTNEYTTNFQNVNHSFISMLNNTKDPYIINNDEDIKLINNIRNKLAHGKSSKYLKITDEVINLIEKVVTNLPAHKNARDYMTEKIITFSLETSLDNVLREVKEKEISQFPIYQENDFIGLLTDNGISKWLSTQIKEDIISISETMVGDIIDRDENKMSYRFISERTSYQEIVNIFSTNYNMSALLVTKNGFENQLLLGIITTYDII